ncbi:YcjX family protein [Vibrio gallaecicus]|uniref:YcjX family protein n=1 Tax=Vibrio gallaecicus TaxID=552386 RepID=UPI0010C97A9C|nr:YcjX family protein [Vibrio gallaecicus]MDN3613779.1 YcjX family protein [Vibrio gallaecicus]
MKKITQEVSDFISRGTDSHVRVAVTGLSRAGKTAFITSLVNQLLHTSTHSNLPLLSSAREGRIIGAKRIPQNNMMIPRFSYDEAMNSLQSDPPEWPVPTRDVSEIRLAIKYQPTKGAKKLFSKNSTLHLDIVDYPGEWLLDLPLLDMDFDTWSQNQFDTLKGNRKEFAGEWLSVLDSFDALADINEKQLADISDIYTQYLYTCKKEGLHWVQPGRFVLPGELAGAPVLQFFPCIEPSEKPSKESNYSMLKSRYEEYQQKVVKAFYKNHFATFDRQIVLVDCLQPLNAGYDSFIDMRNALEQLLTSFKYGRSNLVKRLFSPKIDKILFAASKADHVTPEQHPNLVSLLQQMVHPAWQHAAFEHIDMSCISIASIQATTSGFISRGDENVPALQGVNLEGVSQTLYPGEVPRRLPNKQYWQDNHFEFTSFRPLRAESDQPCQHVRLDKALEFLIGDKLK